MKLMLLGASLSSVACGDPVKFGQDLEESRVIGVRVESESGFANLQPDEQLLVELLIAGSDGPVETRVAYQVCEAADSARGVPFCEGTTFAEGQLEASFEPGFSLEVPEVAEQEQRVAILGVACQDGNPALSDDPYDWACEDDNARPLRFSFDTEVVVDAENENPDLSELVVSFGQFEVALEEISARPDCDEVTELDLEVDYDVEIDLGEEARQPQLDEALQISHFATRGRYERQFTILDPEESVEFSLEWESPEDPAGSDGSENGTIKHYLVVRDGLGGVSWASFSVCAR